MLTQLGVQHDVNFVQMLQLCPAACSFISITVACKVELVV